MGSQVEIWNGFDGTGQNIVATATTAGAGSAGNITTNGTAVVFNEINAADNLHLQATLPTSGDQYTIFWKGQYYSSDQNGAASSGLYAYSLTNLEVNNAPGMNHQRDDFGNGYRVEVFPGTTFGGDDISAYDDTSTTWTTIYDYANGTHQAFANGRDLNLAGSSSLSLAANPTLIIGGYDDGTYFGGSGFNLLGEIEQLIIFEGVLAGPDIAAVESYLGPTLPTLTVNTVSGDVSITGGEEMLDLNGYEILSPSGSLLPDDWLTKNFDARDLAALGAADGENWDVFAASTTRLTEAYFFGSSPFDENRSVSIGQAFNTSGTQDLTFAYQTTDGTTRFGVVEYVTSIAGDFNLDGVVDLADYTVWRDSLGLSGPNLPADANNDELVTAADYDIWKANFGQPSPAAIAVQAVGVPEPAAGLMLGVAAALGGALLGSRHGR